MIRNIMPTATNQIKDYKICFSVDLIHNNSKKPKTETFKIISKVYSWFLSFIFISVHFISQDYNKKKIEKLMKVHKSWIHLHGLSLPLKLV